ncbi:dolichyl-phosphate-mannose--protein mannosyltransferase [Modestobacter versicolor]|uniref:Polyprenol-phosphate-mannose--protein mannosyltransferase n=1 Tax=Modestobacter versicolor TaxID=429133 RepID=A0A323VTL4_9ACTN|nr:phospholipid carrier-dependent glycosyltransferase [Modestobacter versicolor]MBB3676595.1 dolichyl-phosphate-mannose--protein O-mannosyl transferase [Modestobacter versicolor]PZA22298.1 phospholipid carrier-dependent glycosyltransferase [Modestobacter versicolor]
MAVLTPERTESAPEDPGPRRRVPLPRPLRQPTPPLPGDRRLAAVLTALLGVATLVTRLWDIRYPADLVFDEAYYPPEALEVLELGYEYNRGYTFIVHPPLGKLLIAAGEHLFGYDSFGWRFPSAVAGTIAVVVLARLARRLTGSTLLGLVAGLLLALDGFSFSVGRIGLLDVFLQMFVVCAVACLVVDRDRVRQRVREGSDRMTDRMARQGFRLGPRGWRIAAGVLFGSACAVKWSGVYFLALFALLSLWWDRAAWRDAGVTRPTRVALRRGLPGAAWALGVLPVLTYLATFTGWFRGENSQGRHWADQHPDTAFPFVPGALRSLWHMHGEWLTFHNGLSTPHPWESGPWSWLVDGRPILLWNPQGLTDADGNQVIRYILMLGTPTLWFLFAPAMLWLLWRAVARRDPAAVTVGAAIAAGWLTWFVNLDRTMFIFYMAPAVPFFVLAVTLVLQDVLGRPQASALRRQVGLGVVSLYLAVVAMTFAFFYPVLTGAPLTHGEWLQRMWFPSWF